MKVNNRQLIDKYVADTPPPQYGSVSTDLINVYLTLFIYFIVEYNDLKSVRMFAWIEVFELSL